MKALDPVIRKGREKHGATLAPTNRKGVMTILKALKSGSISGILPDQIPDADSGEFAPFFGIPVLTMTLVGKLIQRTDSRVIMAYTKRIDDGFELCFSEPNTDIYSEDQLTALTGMNKSIENFVRESPAQYQWEYKCFKRQPDGNKLFYARK